VVASRLADVKRILASLTLVFFCGPLLAQVPPPGLPAGALVPKVACDADPKETYALYLPSNFSPERKWPIIYVFDPGARGAVAAEVIREAAENFGYIIAASNNSRNGPMGGSAEAARMLWQDTQQRFPIDERRRYVAGMSGGARVAASIALACGDCVAGVIANAAGFAPGTAPPRNMKFAYFAAVGDADFNHAELTQNRRQLDEVGAHYRIRIFEGQHGWAPAEVWLEALSWMDLQAMSAGALPRNPVRIHASLNETLERASAFEAKNYLLAAFREYQSAVRDFHDCLAKNRLAQLEKNKTLKSAQKQEVSELELQAKVEAAPSRQMQKIPSGELDATGLMDLRDSLADLKRQAAGPTRRALVMRRAISGLVVQAYESGQRSMEQKNSSAALLYFDLASAGSENPAWAHFQRARVYATLPDKKKMLAELHLCLAEGFHEAAALDSAEFQAYREQPEFQALMSEWKQKLQP
jgi:dienelactone hydrolase